MPNNLIAIAKPATKQFLARKIDDLRMFTPPKGAPKPRLIALASESFECNTPVVAPLTGQSYDESIFSLQDHIIAIKKPGVYIITGGVFFATYDFSAAPPLNSMPSQWGHIQQAGITFGSEPGASFPYTPVTARTPSYGFQSLNEDLLRFTNIFTTFQNNMNFVLQAGATYSQPQDHAVTLCAEVKTLKIAPLQIYE